MSNTNTIIINGLHNLIDYSTRDNRIANKEFQELHKAVLKYFYNASSIEINTLEKTIFLDVGATSEECKVSLNYDDLSTFLKSCVRADSGNITFYKNLLQYYTKTDAVA